MSDLKKENDELSKELLGLQMFLRGAYGTTDTTKISEIMGNQLKLLVSAACYIDELRGAVKACSGELHHCIGKINDDLKSQITSTDLQPPEYYDYQTVHDADAVWTKEPFMSLTDHNVSIIESFCAFLKSDYHLDKTTYDAALEFIDKLRQD